jgi:hypothetical protein
VDDIREGWDDVPWRTHLGHRGLFDLTLLDEPLEERLAVTKAVAGGRRLPAFEEIGHERLEMLYAYRCHVGGRKA